MLDAQPKHKMPHQAQEKIEYGLVEKKEVDAAVRIYLHSFPHRVHKWFHKEGHAIQFYRDMMELMRLAYGKTFFTARCNGQLIGYLILTMPNRSLFPALLREGFLLRVVAHALLGRYGFSFSVLSRILQAFFALQNSSLESEPSDCPHVCVVAVDKRFTGRGIGSALIEQARIACLEAFGRIWLYVEIENVGAIRLYERIGFRIVKSDPSQHLMIWDFETSGIAGKAE